MIGLSEKICIRFSHLTMCRMLDGKLKFYGSLSRLNFYWILWEFTILSASHWFICPGINDLFFFFEHFCLTETEKKKSRKTPENLTTKLLHCRIIKIDSKYEIAHKWKSYEFHSVRYFHTENRHFLEADKTRPVKFPRCCCNFLQTSCWIQSCDSQQNLNNFQL